MKVQLNTQACYNPRVVEMRGDAAAVRRALRKRARAALRLLGAGLLLCALAPIYIWAALNLSGRLALCQTAPASGMLRGFDFGPLYLRAGQPCRYFIRLVLPAGAPASWTTRFEVLDEGKRPVFREDEARFIGSQTFTAGRPASLARAFTLNKQSGYYYFRLSGADSAYGPDQQGVPVASLAVRQGVISGLWLWLPALALLILGSASLGLAVNAVRRLGAARPAAELSLEPPGAFAPPQPGRRQAGT